MSTGRVSDRRSRGAGVGAVAYFLLTGIIFATWASRVPAIKGGLDLGDGVRGEGDQDRISSWQAIGTTSDWRLRGTWSWSETL
jgi:hypothetical protein